MKKTLVFVLVFAVVLAFSSLAFARGITGTYSKHNLGSTGTIVPSGTFSNNTGQVCVFCHHPHRGSVTGTPGLLWNLNEPASGTTFLMYTSATLNATEANITASKPQSFMCMGCHDGTVAANNLYRKPADATNISGTHTITGTAALTTDLTDDHPVNFNYGAVVTDGDADIISNAGDDINGLKLFAGEVQCATCHDVHAVTDSADAKIQFMRDTTVGSQICKDCHNK